MTEAEARALCERLAAEHPERRTHRRLPRRGRDGWTVVKVRLPEGKRLRPLCGGRGLASLPVPGAWG